jgi:hypothetical protein
MRVRPAGPASLAPATTSNNRPARPSRERPFTAVLHERAGAVPAGAAVSPPRPPTTRPPAANAASASPVRALLERTLGGEQRVDTLLAAAARGKTFSPSELLALQATVFRYSQAVEVVSRATDKLVGAVKQTMGTQV